MHVVLGGTRSYQAPSGRLYVQLEEGLQCGADRYQQLLWTADRPVLRIHEVLYKILGATDDSRSIVVFAPVPK